MQEHLSITSGNGIYHIPISYFLNSTGYDSIENLLALILLLRTGMKPVVEQDDIDAPQVSSPNHIGNGFCGSHCFHLVEMIISFKQGM